MNIYLVGYRCTGKSTVGKMLASRLDWPFVDADEYLEQRAGKSIKRIFEEEGEAHFRQLESRYLQELSARHNLVVATGGGVVLREENVKQMHNTGIVVLLEASPETVFDRLRSDPRTKFRRPSLTSKEPFEEIVELMERRAPLYSAAANIRFDTDVMSAEDVALAICDYLVQVREKR